MQNTEVQDYYTKAWNAAFGSGLTRENVDIIYPRTQNYIYPKRLYTDGRSDAPMVTKNWIEEMKSQGTPGESDLEVGRMDLYPENADFYNTVLSNPDFTPGAYYPRYKRHQLHYDLPVPENYRDPVLTGPQKIAYIPLDIRRLLPNG